MCRNAAKPGRPVRSVVARLLGPEHPVRSQRLLREKGAHLREMGHDSRVGETQSSRGLED